MIHEDHPFGVDRLRWVSTEWFEKNLGRGWTILDVQPDVHDYFLAHIPGAVYLCEKKLRAPQKGMPAQFLKPEVIGRLFSRVGISASKPVLVYTARGGFKGWGDGLDPFMMAYTLLRMDHPEVYLLDGGLDKWMKEGMEISQEFPEVTPTNFMAGVNRSIFIELEELKSVRNNPETILLDARPTEFYTGEAGALIKNGHITGAINLPWSSLMNPRNRTLLKIYEHIEERALKVGVTRDKLVIVYCGMGREATNEYAIFKHLLGYPNVRLYEGSFTVVSSP